VLEASRAAFATQRSAIRARLLSGIALQSDETGLRVGKGIVTLDAQRRVDRP
jgi:hypothetical protein